MRQRRRSAAVIGCSTGGLQALTALLSGLDSPLAAPIIVVCHSGAEDVSLLCELLGRISPLPVREALERTRPEPGVVYIAPSGYHLFLERERCFMLSVDTKVSYVRPSIDVLFESAADAYGEELLGVVLTGANEDGATGLARIRQRGGYALIQDPNEAVAAQMPEAALRIAGADECLSLKEIANRIRVLCS